MDEATLLRIKPARIAEQEWLRLRSPACTSETHSTLESAPWATLDICQSSLGPQAVQNNGKAKGTLRRRSYLRRLMPLALADDGHGLVLFLENLLDALAVLDDASLNVAEALSIEIQISDAILVSEQLISGCSIKK